MATTVISKPEGLCLSGNLPKIKVQSDAQVRVQLLAGEKTLLDETYTPDFDSLVLLDIADVVINELTFTVPAANVFIQPDIRKNFVLKINTTSYNFTALRCGIRDFGDTATNFLTKNFLTWQPREKKITRNQPEFLTYHATQASFLFITAYYETGMKLGIGSVAMTAGNVYTVNIGSMLKSLPKTLVAVEAVVYATGFPSNKISKYQYYSIAEELPDDRYFLFENSLGGIDTVRCTGEIKSEPEFTREAALMGDTELTFFTEKKDAVTQNTGNIKRSEAAWLHDFFISKKTYVLTENKLKSVVIDSITAEASSKEDLRSFEFTYRPAETSDYLIIYERLTEYTSAAYANAVCQRIDEVITFTSASYANPVCQKIEQTITYTSAGWTNPVCQMTDDSITYTGAEWISPICQLEEITAESILLTINLKKHPLLSNSILITWAFKNESILHFETKILLQSDIRTRSGMLTGFQTIEINFIAAAPSGTAVQTVQDIDMFIADGTQLIKMDPNEIDGQPINVIITLN
ncbi:MAG: hypothetical protein LBK94_06775 [Prevotellaceae bacterium]|jgi:hypothetical protein|nr:hypothetical protein [Prevotellaceae bacterium]